MCQVYSCLPELPLVQWFSTCGGSNNPFTGVTYQNPDHQIFTTVANYSYEVATKSSYGFGGGITTTRRTVLKVRRVRQVETHCSSAPDLSVLPFSTPGNIENTEKLQYSGEKLYKFTVTAYDCGKKRAADDAEVEIQVKPTCKPSWQGEGGDLQVKHL